MRTFSFRLPLIVLLCGLFLVAILPGCTPAKIADAQAKVAKLRATTESVEAGVTTAVAEKYRIDELLAALPAGETRDKAIALSAKLEQYVTVGNQWLGKANVSLKTFEAERAEADNTLDVVEGGARSILPWIPAPWGQIGMGILTVLSIWRARSVKKTAKKVINAVDTLVNPTGNEALLISALQGTDGTRLVDEAQKKVFSLPF